MGRSSATPPNESIRDPRADRRSTRQRGAARREVLLEAVLRVVADLGADAVTHRRVAQEAGLPLASTTYYFTSKDDILTAALELAAERDTQRLLSQSASILADVAIESSAAVAAAVDLLAEPVGSEPQGGRRSLLATYALLLEAARRPAMQQIAARWSEVYLLVLGQLLERAGSQHPRGDAELLLATADGLLVEQLALGTSRDLRPRLRRVALALVVPG